MERAEGCQEPSAITGCNGPAVLLGSRCEIRGPVHRSVRARLLRLHHRPCPLGFCEVIEDVAACQAQPRLFQGSRLLCYVSMHSYPGPCVGSSLCSTFIACPVSGLWAFKGRRIPTLRQLTLYSEKEHKFADFRVGMSAGCTGM